MDRYRIAILLGLFLNFVVCNYVQENYVIGAFSEPPSYFPTVVSQYMHIASAHFNLVLGGLSANTSDTIARQQNMCMQFHIKVLTGGYETFDLQDLPLCNASSCEGFFVKNEPCLGDFKRLAWIIQTLRTQNPTKLAFVNLLGSDAGSSAWGTDNFASYISRYVDAVHPDVISFNNFVDFRNPKSKYIYEESLVTVRKIATASGTPFWNFFGIMPFHKYDDPTDAQLKWQIYTSLAYGAKGLIYYCYWNPYRPDLFGSIGDYDGAIMKHDGTKTRHYNEAQTINRIMKYWGTYFLNFETQEVLHIFPVEDPRFVLEGSPIKSLSKGYEYLVAKYLNKPDNNTAVLVNNYSDLNTMWSTFEWDSRYSRVLEVDQRGLLMPVFDESPRIPGLQLSFASGEGRLFVFIE